MATTVGQGWAQLRQQARALEAQTETFLQTYSQFSTQTSIPPKPTEEERNAEANLQELLDKREGVIAQLGRLLDSEATLTSSALKQNNLALLRDKLADHRRDLSRLRTTLKEARDRANLLGSVRDDISAYRAANPAAAEAEYMLDERSRLDRSHDVADSVLSQAYAVQDSFALQRETLASINRRITLAASQVPGINTLIGRISAKKRRDGIIMGSFIAFCFLVFWFFL
ncbi:Golgi SNAP receptor complex member 1 [Madurella mycetomatis]|uniref:Golgi SNAP receptor complex member 1 n=1 Tax=Madurella mycetomatis TaxID=100816 RepID=A0A175WHS1_9PEZI|nr:Golgi SNAP receptor complex member 1 [Madurella mycetomatis]KXX83049.1 Golgi SNAP receptor complex member 1 [Madurella mycetomatis]